ncbi:hypothetical protein P0Y31_09160 [Knoellia sp. 3-2P3]|uniref:hypothetical protein n=1 Tax=unclassified Knoellia TaxID=2618719 RepID=UPI0023DC30DA|nr:hypothetical protein [Knoellia sp. 3-2P3]MDF2092512.1 hypothetical protein [Knoellia sp. 3-2P3]
MSGYLPIPGSPDVVEAVAAALRDEAQRIASTHERLLALRTHTSWDSPAGRAFAAELALLPRVLDLVAQRYAGAAAALRAFASEFREAQLECNLAISLRERGAWRRNRHAEALARAETSASPADLAQVPGLHRLMVEGAAEVLDAEGRYGVACERFDQADRRCRRALAALDHDSLTDSLQYDTIKGAGALADDVTRSAGYVALVPVWAPAAKAVGATSAAAGLLLDGMVKVAFDEGDWGPMVEEFGLGVLGFGAASLRTAGLARGLPSAAHRGPSGFASSSQRLRAGVKEQATANDPWRVGPARVRPPQRSLPAAGALPLGGRVKREVRGRVDRTVKGLRGDWGVATRNGADARAMLLTAWGLKAGSTTYTGAKKVNAAYERVMMARERWLVRERRPAQAP